jgi:starch phosphorylase
MGEKKNSERARLTPSNNPFMGNDIDSLKNSFINHLEYSCGKDEYSSTKNDLYISLALAVRDRIMERWILTQQSYYKNDVKRVYYLSLEFLMGRTLKNSLINLGIYDIMKDAVADLGYDFEDLAEKEFDAGLGNGGLGRLAACFMDSLATLEIPACGYGIRYEYGIFFQRIRDGWQVETPDNWLRYGNQWEIPRAEYIYPVKFYGRIHQYTDQSGKLKCEWVDYEEIMAMAYDTPIPGYRNNTVNNLRLWSAKSTREFNLEYFNHGDYEKAVSDKAYSENLSKVLYPNDNVFEGRELRLKQEYFFVSATIQDIIRRFRKLHNDLRLLHEKVAIQLNDTHPAIAIPELMRTLIDEEGYVWDEAWEATVRVFGYTNHTILPEALEKWPIYLFGKVLPRHLQIIYEINKRFLETVYKCWPGEWERLSAVSIIEEAEEKKVRMANLAIIGSHSVNGVAKMHSDILKNKVFREFHELWPERFNNKTNGITQRRWLALSNRRLAGLISSKIGEAWTTDLFELKRIEDYVDDKNFIRDWQDVKLENKKDLSDYILHDTGVSVRLDSIFDIQVKRIHEYKRQLLNVLHAVTLYNRIRGDSGEKTVPRTIILAGKAAPGYAMAKLIIKLINSVSDLINNDPAVGDRLKVVFLENYSVSLAERIIPAADLSQQISTAGTEASGTGNMKFALSGAVTIGTLDGANIEMIEEIGRENMFIFGLDADEISSMKAKGYNPWDFYNSNNELKKAIDMISGGYFSPFQQDLFRPLTDSLLMNGDSYMLLADYDSYIRCQDSVAEAYKDTKKWCRMSMLNVSRIGKFSTDRTIRDYADEIWSVQKAPVLLNE